MHYFSTSLNTTIVDRRPVDFFLGKSNKRLGCNYNSSSHSTDTEDSSSSEYFSSSSSYTNSTEEPYANISLITPPGYQTCFGQLMSSAKTPANKFNYSFEEISSLTKQCSEKGLPPSPPQSVYEDKNPSTTSKHTKSKPANKLSSSSANNSLENNHNANTVLLPSTVLFQNKHVMQHEFKISPLNPKEHKLIPINLEPVSPLLLAAEDGDDEFEDDDSDCDNFTLEEEDEVDAINDQFLEVQEGNLAQSYQNNNVCINNGEDYETVSPEFLVGYEQEIISHLNLEEDVNVVDKFRMRPLLADGNRPYIPCSPVFSTVEELLQVSYPEIQPGSSEYNQHLNRLKRNRTKLRRLSDCIDMYDRVRRKRIYENSVNSRESKEDKRFRSRQ